MAGTYIGMLERNGQWYSIYAFYIPAKKVYRAYIDLRRVLSPLPFTTMALKPVLFPLEHDRQLIEAPSKEELIKLLKKIYDVRFREYLG